MTEEEQPEIHSENQQNEEAEDGVSFSDSSDDSSSSYHEIWEDKIVVIQSHEFWEKPKGHTLYITQASISPPYGSKDMKGILMAVLEDDNVVISCLNNENPVQVMNLVWNDFQELMFYNDGNRPITLSLMIRH